MAQQLLDQVILSSDVESEKGALANNKHVTKIVNMLLDDKYDDSEESNNSSDNDDKCKYNDIVGIMLNHYDEDTENSSSSSDMRIHRNRNKTGASKAVAMTRSPSSAPQPLKAKMGGLRFSDAIRKKEKKTQFRFGAPSVAKDSSSSDDKSNGGRQGKFVRKSSRKAKKLPPSMVAERVKFQNCHTLPPPAVHPQASNPGQSWHVCAWMSHCHHSKSINPATGRGRVRRLTPPETN